MAGSRDRRRLRTSTCPSSGCGTGSSVNWKSLSFGSPLGRAASRIWRLVSGGWVIAPLLSPYGGYQEESNPSPFSGRYLGVIFLGHAPRPPPQRLGTARRSPLRRLPRRGVVRAVAGRRAAVRDADPEGSAGRAVLDHD